MKSDTLWLRGIVTPACALGVAIMCGTVQAQDTSSSMRASAEADSIPTIETVVVTAKKRTALLRDVPSTVNLIDEQTLAAARVEDVEGIARLVPGLEIGKFTGEQIGLATIRGVSPQTFGDPTVVVFQDGIALGNSTKGVTADIFDLERVEVLKGPQATLYGANSLGGTINLVSRRPSSDFEGQVRTSYGEYDSIDAYGAISGPLVAERLAVRLSGGIRERDGYWDNAFTGEKNVDGVSEESVRLGFLWTPSSRFESYLVYAYARTDTDCSDCVNPVKAFDPMNPAQVGSGAIDVDDLDEAVNQNVLGYFERKLHQVTWENSYDAGRFTITSLTGYGQLKTDSVTDLDRTPGNIFGIVDSQNLTDFDVLSEELRFTSATQGRFQWLVGAYYSTSTNDGASLFNFGVGPPVPALSSDGDFDNLAFFTDNSFALTDALELGFGLRYDRAEKSLFDHVSNLSNSVTTNEWLPRVSLTWRLDESTNVYAAIARGYKTGGLNPSSTLSPTPAAYDPEFLWNYELGLKGVAGGGNLAYELAAYYIDWTDQQVQQASGITTFITNAGETEIYGTELSVHYIPTDRLNLHLGLAYNHARYRSYIDSTAVPLYFGAAPDRSGSPTFLAPDWTAVVAAEYVHRLGDRLDLRGRADVRYTGDRSLDTAGILQGDPYTIVNLRLSGGTERTRITLFANNVFDERYATAGSLFAGIQPLTHLGDPRVAGIQLDLSF